MLQVAMLNSLMVFLFAYFLRIDQDISLWFSSGLVCIFSCSAIKKAFFMNCYLFFFSFMLLLLFVPCFIEFAEGGACGASAGDFKRIRGLPIVVEHYGNQWQIVSP